MAEKILIANRGEIAVRIIRACRELSIPTVAVYSTADEHSLHVKLADEAVCIGNPRSPESYLNINNIISAALATGATMIHPGYGFLSENDQFAEIVSSCNIKFIGPTAETIRQIGDKASAKKIAKKVGVPIIDGSEGIVESLEEGLAIAKKIGFPVMLKATSGGGGRGISIINNAEDFKSTFNKTSMEAEASFGDKNLYVEKYIESPRHVEIQVFGDDFGHVVYLGERDCSMQRRNQKLLEESPSPVLNEHLRRKMGEAAVKLAKAVKYVNAGTIEFLVDKKLNYYFIEMNTRIQVEHPVTEQVTGRDLVKEQIRVAQGKPLSFKQHEIKIKGHAIECRINAEDPFKFTPSPGRITAWHAPGGPGIRVDSHAYAGYYVPPHYDSMVGKVIAYGATREQAIRRMQIALSEMVVEGIQTNIPLHRELMVDASFAEGGTNIHYLEHKLADKPDLEHNPKLAAKK
jgi:acetyl-CoA carboxylase biotin carboxylase subunit